MQSGANTDRGAGGQFHELGACSRTDDLSLSAEVPCKLRHHLLVLAGALGYDHLNALFGWAPPQPLLDSNAGEGRNRRGQVDQYGRAARWGHGLLSAQEHSVS